MVSKRAQKMAKKNMNSVNRKSMNANLYMSIMYRLCFPAKPSMTMSLVHIRTKYTSARTLITTCLTIPYLKKTTREVVSLNKLSETHMG